MEKINVVTKQEAVEKIDLVMFEQFRLLHDMDKIIKGPKENKAKGLLLISEYKKLEFKFKKMCKDYEDTYSDSYSSSYEDIQMKIKREEEEK